MLVGLLKNAYAAKPSSAHCTIPVPPAGDCINSSSTENEFDDTDARLVEEQLLSFDDLASSPLLETSTVLAPDPITNTLVDDLDSTGIRGPTETGDVERTEWPPVLCVTSTLASSDQPNVKGETLSSTVEGRGGNMLRRRPGKCNPTR